MHIEVVLLLLLNCVIPDRGAMMEDIQNYIIMCSMSELFHLSKFSIKLCGKKI